MLPVKSEAQHSKVFTTNYNLNMSGLLSVSLLKMFYTAGDFRDNVLNILHQHFH